MRLAAALAVIAVAWAAALWLHERQVTHAKVVASCPGGGCTGGLFGKGETETYLTVKTHPTWEDPVALGVAIGALAVGAGIVGYRRPQ